MRALASSRATAEVRSSANRCLGSTRRRINSSDDPRNCSVRPQRTGAYLTAVLSSLYRVKAHLKSDDVVLLNDVAESITKVEAASDVIRRVAHMLHPSRLEHGGLVETLRWYVNAVSGQHLTVTAELPTAAIKMSKEGEIVLFRLVQECLNYIVGRSGAREADIHLTGDGVVSLNIAIHGPLPLGLRDALTAGQNEFGIGFAGIRERLLQLGGTLNLIGGGNRSVVEASFPLES